MTVNSRELMGLKLYLFLEPLWGGATLFRRNGVLAVDTMTTLEPNSETHTLSWFVELGIGSESEVIPELWSGPEGGYIIPPVPL